MFQHLALCSLILALVGSASSRTLLASAVTSNSACAEAIAAAVTVGVLSNTTSSNVTLVRDQLVQVIGSVLRSDEQCGTATVSDLALAWEQYPSWVNGAFTDWIWHLKTDAATAQYFGRVRFDGPEVLPPPAAVTPTIMREYASIHNEDAIVYSSDLSGFSASWAVEQKGLTDYTENVCLDVGNPRGLLHPRTFLLLFYRPDALAALAAAAVTPAAAAAAAGPPNDWDGLVALLEAHAAAMQAQNMMNVNTWSAGIGSGGNDNAAAGNTTAGLPQYGLCITTHPTCGRLGDVLAAISASMVQSRGMQQGYVFDLNQPPPAAAPRVGGAGWRRASDTLRRLLAFNAPDYYGGDSNTTAATNCHAFSPWFKSGNCLITIEFDSAFMSMGVPPLNASGALGVAPLPGSRAVEAPGGVGMEDCAPATCAVSANHDLLYLTPAGRQAAVLAAAKAARAKCGSAEAARMEAVAVAAAGASAAAAGAIVNRAPYSAVYDYFAFINYELMGMVGLGQEMSLIQLNIASRLTSERLIRQAALDALRAAVAAASGSVTAAAGGTAVKWDASEFASTPWWTALSGGGGDGNSSIWAPPSAVLAPFVARGLNADAVASYLQAVLHALHSPNAAPDIQAPVMVNWFKWGLGHAALSLLPPQPASPDSVTELLTRVFGMVNEAHTPASVRTAYEVAINAAAWRPTGSGGSGSGLTAGARAALFAGVGSGALVACLLLALLLRQRSRHRDLLGRVRAPRAGPDTTLLISDVQSSTKLWEQVSVPVMDEALKLHHTTFRRLLPLFNGYESATEGDSFILAFADPASAVAFASACQVALLLQPWPSELLCHPDGSALLVDPQTGEAAQRAGVPGGEGRRLHSSRGAPAPGSLNSRLTWPARYLTARVRVAAASAVGRRGGGAGPARPLPQQLRGSSAAAAYAIGLAREVSYDISVHSGGASVLRRSMDGSTQPTSPRISAAVAAGSARSLAPPPAGQAVVASEGNSRTNFGSRINALSGSDVVCGSGSGHESSSVLSALAPKPEALAKSDALLTSSGPVSDSWELGRTDAGTGKPVLSSSKLFIVREASTSLPQPSGAAASQSASQQQQQLQQPGQASWWAAALQAVFPAVAANDAPPAVLGGQLLKSPTVVLPGGRLGVIAYRGLRVRMGLHTGLDDPQHIAFNKVGSTFKYYGPFAEITKTAIAAAPGGMVVLTEPAFTRLRHCMAKRSRAATKWERDNSSIVVYGGHHVMPASEHHPPPEAAKGERPAAAHGVRLELGGGGSGASQREGAAPRPSDDGAEGAGAAVVLAAPAPAEGLALFQAVPSALACRLALSPQLVSVRVAQLGSLAAPVGCITVAFMYVVGASTLLADLPGPAARALEQYQRLACGLLAAAGGYLVEGGDGLLLAAFGSPLAGVEWALDCLAGLKELEWEEDLLGHWLCEEVLSVGLAGAGLDAEALNSGADGGAGAGVGVVLGSADAASLARTAAGGSVSRRALGREFDRLPSMARLGTMAQTQRVLERGLRIKVGLDTGRASHWLTDASGRLSYRGKVMNRASRVAGKAAAGQVVCTDVTWTGCLETSQAMEISAEALGGRGASGRVSSSSGGGLVGVSLGKVLLRGVTAPVELVQCMRS